MSSETRTSRSRFEDAEGATAALRTDADAVDATVASVGTFAAGQSVDGRYVAVTAAPQGSFAAGQAEDDEETSPEARPSDEATSPEARPSHAA